MKHPRTHVTDHAVLRYLERVLRLDIEAHRREIGRLVDRAVQEGASGVVIDGMAYRMVRDAGVPVVVTIRPARFPDSRRGRKPRRRGGTP
ncbi:hypothetical protein [Pararhodobacter sp.]|uniref:hypothetical protein n=1 Tax=Pararhodobacter sp. TaxID=2127056 RepID=UPI002AFF5A69|nr:hypothetical protein [Pararhodobacter sp.]